MVSLPPQLRALIDSGVHAHLSTINLDGSPQVSVTFLGRDGDQPYTYHRERYVKLRNMERDNRVTLSFLAPAVDSPRQDYVVLRARAQVADAAEVANLAELVREMRTPYLGAEGARANPPVGGYLVRYDIERIGGVGPWTDANRGSGAAAATSQPA
jgi:PPOX class probable F420-dependent enzyme